jgi:hypothetical protein
MDDKGSDYYFNRQINLSDIQTFLYYLAENAIRPIYEDELFYFE